MDTVPSVETTLWVRSLPKLNMQFSMAFGIPMRRILRMIEKSGR
jgi:hypothetical protein